MVLGALLTFCICKRRKQNRRRKGKTPPPSTVKSLGTCLSWSLQREERVRKAMSGPEVTVGSVTGSG